MPEPVAFLFTDIEGYTRHWEHAPDAMRRAQGRHDALVGGAIEAHGGHVFKTIGDAYQATFPSVTEAVAGAIAAQQALAQEDWSAILGFQGPLRVRMAVDLVPARPVDGDYRTPNLNRVARLMASGHGGQVLLTGVARDALVGALPPGCRLRALGPYRLKDLRQPVTVYQVLAADMPDVALPPRTAGPLATPDRIVVVDPRVGDGNGGGPAAERPLPALLAELAAVVRGERETVRLTLADVHRLAQHRPADLSEYRLIRLAEWSQPRYRLDSRFVALTLLLDHGTEAIRGREENREPYRSLGKLLARDRGKSGSAPGQAGQRQVDAAAAPGTGARLGGLNETAVGPPHLFCAVSTPIKAETGRRSAARPAAMAGGALGGAARVLAAAGRASSEPRESCSCCWTA